MKSSTRRRSVGPRAAAEDDVQELRLPALDRRQLLHVRADLQDRRRLDVACELGVGHLVVPRTERAVGLARRVVPAEQEVRMAAPGPVEEGGLVDDVRAGTHGIEGLGGGRSELRPGIPGRADPARVLPAPRPQSRPSRSPPRSGPRPGGPRGSAPRARGRASRSARSRDRSGSASRRGLPSPPARGRAGARRRGSPRDRWRRRRGVRRSAASPAIVRGTRASSPVTAVEPPCPVDSARGTPAEAPQPHQRARRARGGAHLGEPRRPPDPRGDGRRQVR